MPTEGDLDEEPAQEALGAKRRGRSSQRGAARPQGTFRKQQPHSGDEGYLLLSGFAATGGDL